MTMHEIKHELTSWLQNVNNELTVCEGIVEKATLNKDSLTQAVYQEVVYQLGLVKYKLEKLLLKIDQQRMDLSDKMTERLQ